MRRISVPGLLPQRSCRGPRIIAIKRMKLLERNCERPVMGSLRTLQPGVSSECSYRQVFAKA
jgi:hypothetical protein